MVLFAWCDDYAMRIPSIDAQHRGLVDMLNSLHNGMLEGTGQEQLGPLLRGLIDYTGSHFEHEEQLFAQYQYPQAERHTQEHRELTQKVLEFKDKLESGQARITVELMIFLKDWLIHHILGSDKAYSKHLIERGAR